MLHTCFKANMVYDSLIFCIRHLLVLLVRKELQPYSNMNQTTEGPYAKLMIKFKA
jgi:hypothetical protein